MSKSLFRIISFVLVLGLVLVLPWWLSCVLLIILTIFLPLYLEVILFGFIIDLVYSPNLTFPYPASTMGLLLILLVSFLRNYVRT